MSACSESHDQDPRFHAQRSMAGAGDILIGYFFFEIPSNVILTHGLAPRPLGFGPQSWRGWGVIYAANGVRAGPDEILCLRFLLGLAEAGTRAGMNLLSLAVVPGRGPAPANGAAYFSPFPLNQCDRGAPGVGVSSSAPDGISLAFFTAGNGCLSSEELPRLVRPWWLFCSFRWGLRCAFARNKREARADRRRELAWSAGRRGMIRIHDVAGRPWRNSRCLASVVRDSIAGIRGRSLRHWRLAAANRPGHGPSDFGHRCGSSRALLPFAGIAPLLGAATANLPQKALFAVALPGGAQRAGCFALSPRCNSRSGWWHWALPAIGILFGRSIPFWHMPSAFPPRQRAPPPASPIQCQSANLGGFIGLIAVGVGRDRGDRRAIIPADG